MSASDKKKLRKEQTAATTTERQRTEQKNQKKQKAYTITFIVAMVLVVAIFLGTALQTPVMNLRIKTSTAVTVNDHKVGGQEFNYFYVDAISTFCNNFVSQYGDYAAMLMQWSGLDPNTSLGSQTYNQETGETWADYFAKSAVESTKWTYAMYDKAQADKFTLTEDQQKSVDSYKDSLKSYADKNNISVNNYIQSIYGSTADLDSYMEYYQLTAIATAYASKYYDGLEFTNDQLREFEKDKYNDYSSYSYAVYTLNVSDYLTGGTKETDEDGKTTTVYSDAEKQAAVDAALADAKKLAEDATIDSVKAFNLAIGAIKKDKTCTETTDALLSSLSLNEDMEKWLTDDERKEGDVSYFTNTTKTDDKETVSSYTVVLYLNCNKNTSYEGTVRHLLVAFEGGKKDNNGNTTYSDAEKNAAKTAAEKLLKEFLEGDDQSEEAFTALLKKHSDDVDSKGNVNNDGLYENITPASNFVKAFEDWAYADHKPGDTGIIETDYGYHIMYYVKDGEHTYRDLLIESDMAQEAYTEWEEDVVDTVTVKDGKPVVNTNFIIPSSFYSSYGY